MMNSNPHWHVLTRLDDELADAVEFDGQKTWKNIQRRGQLHVEEINSPDKAWSYCLKDRDFDYVFIYNDTRKHS